jgi:hypothetical protein
MRLRSWFITVFLLGSLSLFGCATAPKETVELSEITENQVVELQKSHIRFVQLYYSKLRDSVNDFIDHRWMPLFLSKVVKNEVFRKDLDEAYVTSSIESSDVQVTWQGKPLQEPQKSAVLSGVEKAITDERARLGGVLLDFSDEAQRQINKKRQELLRPIDEQERLVIDEINAAYADLQGAQATIKAYLSSVVELKESQDLVMEKLEILERSERIVNAALNANETLTVILEEEKDVEKALEMFLSQIEEAQKRIRTEISPPRPPSHTEDQ